MTLAPQRKALLQDPAVAERYRVMNIAHVVKLKVNGRLRAEVEKRMGREEAKMWSKRVEKMAEVTERLREEERETALETAGRHEYEIKLRKTVEGLNGEWKGRLHMLSAHAKRWGEAGPVDAEGVRAIGWGEAREVHTEWRPLLEVITRAWVKGFFEKLGLDKKGELDLGNYVTLKRYAVKGGCGGRQVFRDGEVYGNVPTSPAHMTGHEGERLMVLLPGPAEYFPPYSPTVLDAVSEDFTICVHKSEWKRCKFCSCATVCDACHLFDMQDRTTHKESPVWVLEHVERAPAPGTSSPIEVREDGGKGFGCYDLEPEGGQEMLALCEAITYGVV